MCYMGSRSETVVRTARAACLRPLDIRGLQAPSTFFGRHLPNLLLPARVRVKAAGSQAQRLCYADTKLIPSWFVGERDGGAAHEFVTDLASRLQHRVQITTDGHRPYIEAIEGAFGSEVDYAMLVKIYGQAPEGQRRYSPPVCQGAVKNRIEGNPDRKHVSTSYVERQNLSMRMGMRRFTRLTNAFSKKVENHVHAISIYFMHYNFVRIHQTLRITPAMAAGVTDKLWNINDLAELVD